MTILSEKECKERRTDIQEYHNIKEEECCTVCDLFDTIYDRDRQVKELEEAKDKISENVIALLGSSACEKHQKTFKAISFNEFYSKYSQSYEFYLSVR